MEEYRILQDQCFACQRKFQYKLIYCEYGIFLCENCYEERKDLLEERLDQTKNQTICFACNRVCFEPYITYHPKFKVYLCCDCEEKRKFWIKETEKVQVPKEYQASIEERFNPKNATTQHRILYHIAPHSTCYGIIGKCYLCERYNTCKECPFKNCKEWIARVIGEEPLFTIKHNCIYWMEDKKVRKQLELLQNEAKKLIEWI